MKTKEVFIPLNKMMLYLGQTSICIKQEKDAAIKAKKLKIAQKEIKKYPGGISAGRECVSLDNRIVRLFRQAGVY